MADDPLRDEVAEVLATKIPWAGPRYRASIVDALLPLLAERDEDIARLRIGEHYAWTDVNRLTQERNRARAIAVALEAENARVCEAGNTDGEDWP